MKTASLLAIVTLLPTLAAQDKAPAGKPFVLEPGEIGLPDLIDRCAAHLHCNILSNQAELANAVASGGSQIRLQQRLEVDHDGCEDLLSSMLARAGFVLTVLDEPKHLYEIINVNGPRGREVANRAVRRTPEEILRRPALRMPVTTVLELQHVNANIAVNALRPFFASTGSPTGGGGPTLGTAGGTTAIVISGLQDQVATAIGIVRTADVANQPEVDKSVTERLDAIERRLAALEHQAKNAEKSEVK